MGKWMGGERGLQLAPDDEVVEKDVGIRTIVKAMVEDLGAPLVYIDGPSRRFEGDFDEFERWGKSSEVSERLILTDTYP